MTNLIKLVPLTSNHIAECRRRPEGEWTWRENPVVFALRDAGYPGSAVYRSEILLEAVLGDGWHPAWAAPPSQTIVTMSAKLRRFRARYQATRPWPVPMTLVLCDDRLCALSEWQRLARRIPGWVCPGVAA